MALVFYASEVLACLPALVKRDLNSYMREAFQDPFKPRGHGTLKSARMSTLDSGLR